MDYFYNVFMKLTFWSLEIWWWFDGWTKWTENIKKYLNLHFENAQMSYGFETTWVWDWQPPFKNIKQKNCHQKAGIAKSQHLISGITFELKVDYILHDYPCNNVRNTVKNNNISWPDDFWFSTEPTYWSNINWPQSVTLID